MTWFEKLKEKFIQRTKTETQLTYAEAQVKTRRQIIGSFIVIAIAGIFFALFFDTRPRDINQTNQPAAQDMQLSAEQPLSQDENEVLVAGSLADNEQVVTNDEEQLIKNIFLAEKQAADTVHDEQLLATNQTIAQQSDSSAPTTQAKPAEAVKTTNSPAGIVTNDRVTSATNAQATIKATQQQLKLQQQKVAQEKLQQQKVAQEKLKQQKIAQEKLKQQQEQAQRKKEQLAKQAAQAQQAKKAEQVRAILSGQRFVIQIGAFADPNKAKDMQQKVQKLGLNVVLQKSEFSGGSITRVRTVVYNTKEEVEQQARKLAANNIDYKIIPQ